MARITIEQKLDAIFRYENGEESLTSIAKSLNLTTTEMLNFWIEKYHLALSFFIFLQKKDISLTISNLQRQQQLEVMP